MAALMCAESWSQTPAMDPYCLSWHPCFSALVMLLFVLFGSVYTGGVGAIVSGNWWRLEIHNRVPRECHCWLLTTISNCQARSSGWVGVSPSTANSMHGNSHCLPLH